MFSAIINFIKNLFGGGSSGEPSRHPGIIGLLDQLGKGKISGFILKELSKFAKSHPKLLEKEVDLLIGKENEKDPKPGTHQTWKNQMATQVVQPLYYFKPSTLKGPNSVVDILRQALETGNSVKAAGSGHSYSDVATTPDYFIDTHALNRPSSSSKPISGQLSAGQLRSPLQLGVEPIDWHNTYDPENNRALFETEAGITIHDLNKVLEERNLGLMNMGGYDGQTIMGATSTSTHGSGISLPPFPDMLRSVVLATTGTWNGSTIGGSAQGQVNLYRIEPSDGITDPNKYNDPEIQLIQNDDCFYAVICNMGTMGVIYSIVIEVMQMYWLEENRYYFLPEDDKKPITLDVLFDQFLAPNPNNPGHLPDKLLQIRNFEVLIHPYPLDGDHVVEMDTTQPENYYKYFHCLVTERNIVPNPGGPVERKGHRNFFAQLLAMLPISFEILVTILNWWPKLVPFVITESLLSLQDKNYINKSFHIYDLGLNQDAGFATEIGFSLQDDNGNYTLEHFKAAIDRIHAIAQDARMHGEQYQTSPFSLRFVKSSNAQLSMMQGINTAMIEMDMVTGTYGGPEIMFRYQQNMYDIGGRPHWGLEFDNLTGSNQLVQNMYPEFDKWYAVYEQLNSKGTFDNSFTNRLGFSKNNFVRGTPPANA
ncbi:MAG: D-arabinono-1,4-lactone oxidase [Bacteroidota bacterium]